MKKNGQIMLWIVNKCYLISIVLLLSSCRFSFTGNQQKLSDSFIAIISNGDTTSFWNNCSHTMKKGNKSILLKEVYKIHETTKRWNKQLEPVESAAYTSQEEGYSAHSYFYKTKRTNEKDTILKVELSFVDQFPDKISGITTNFLTPKESR